MANEINGTLIERCANFNIFQAEYNGYPIVYRVWKNRKVEFKVTEDLVNAGLAIVVEPGVLESNKEYWIDPTRRG
ncbi:hypothetical protein [Bacteroides neonati]|uniref:hypothetical protein n=1 Tax=Bacteroides neonati TaxID=1347393 RepID=UPI0005A87D1E|nr:hypothetical protein [Bacteroides neonati]